MAGRLDDRGTVLVEFALLLPLLVLLLLASMEYFTLVLMTQKTQRVAATMADLVAQADDPLTGAQVDALFAAAGHVMEPFDHGVDGRAIVSGVVLNGGAPVVAWQRSDTGALAVASGVGQPGQRATLPAGLPLRAGETIVVAEAFQAFRPTLTVGILPARVIAERAYYRPRLGQLTSLN